MEKIIIKFEVVEIEKNIFHEHKRPISVKNIETNKIVVSNKVSLVKKDLNLLQATKIQKKIKSLCILESISAFRKDFMKLNMCFFNRK